MDRPAVDARRHSHLFIVAQPLAAREDLLSAVIDADEIRTVFDAARTRITGGNRLIRLEHWDSFGSRQPRAHGFGMHNGLPSRMFDASVEEVKEQELIDLEFNDDGRITLFFGGASLRNSADEQAIDDETVVVLTQYTMTLVGELGKAAGYGGRWFLALGVDDLAGKDSKAWHHDFMTTPNPYSDERYIRGEMSNSLELLHKPGTVARRLLSRLLRALRTQHRLDHRFNDYG